MKPISTFIKSHLDTPDWSCKLKGFKFPSGFSIGTTIRRHELTKINKIEMNDSCPFEKSTFFQIAYILLLYTKATSCSFYNTDNTWISICLTLDCVIQMKLMIPFFQTEFDPQQVLKKGRCQNPPFGDLAIFWWLLWLFSQKDKNRSFQFCSFQLVHDP